MYYFADVFYNNIRMPMDSGGYLKEANNTKGDTSAYIVFDKCIKKINKIGGNIGIGIITNISKKLKLDVNAGLGLAEKKLSLIKW